MTEEHKSEQSSLSDAQAKAFTELNGFFKELLDRKTGEAVRSVYANYANFELSDLDLKIIFGQLAQTGAKKAVDWHTAVTMTWAEAKLVSFFLRVNIAIYEAQYGIIKVPASMLPPLPPPPEENMSQAFVDAVRAIHDELMQGQQQPTK
jgi:hypothetical protein